MTAPSLGGYNHWTAPLFLAMAACDSHSSSEVGPQLVPFSRLSSPPPPHRGKGRAAVVGAASHAAYRPPLLMTLSLTERGIALKFDGVKIITTSFLLTGRITANCAHGFVEMDDKHDKMNWFDN